MKRDKEGQESNNIKWLRLFKVKGQMKNKIPLCPLKTGCMTIMRKNYDEIPFERQKTC